MWELAAAQNGAHNVDQQSRIRSALSELQDARHYASEVGCDPWEFALEMGRLHATGASLSDLRWLVCMAYVEHADELTEQGDSRREFQSTGNLRFSTRTCFVLTDDGAAFLHNDQSRPPPSANTSNCAGADAGLQTQDKFVSLPAGKPRLPLWKPDLRELHYEAQLVKRFKVPAPNQERLLAAFQEEGWRARIDDPLPPQPGQDTKRRLHDTIKSLNRHQVCCLLRFRGDGTGQGAIWERVV